MTGRRQRPNQVRQIMIGTIILLGLDSVAWVLWMLWHVMPWLLTIAAVVFACRRWHLHRTAAAWLTSAHQPARFVRGQVINDPAAADRAELARLRDDNAKLRAKVRVLSDFINGPEARP